jgi:hypothetical protein
MGHRLILSQSFLKFCLNFGTRLFRSPMCVVRGRSFLMECACAGEFAQFALLFGLHAVRPSPLPEAGPHSHSAAARHSCGVGAHALRTHSARALSLCRAARSCPVDSATVPEASQRPSAPSTPSSSFAPTPCPFRPAHHGNLCLKGSGAYLCRPALHTAGSGARSLPPLALSRGGPQQRRGLGCRADTEGDLLDAGAAIHPQRAGGVGSPLR